MNHCQHISTDNDGILVSGQVYVEHQKLVTDLLGEQVKLVGNVRPYGKFYPRLSRPILGLANPVVALDCS